MANGKPEQTTGVWLRLRRRWKWAAAGLLALLVYTLVGFYVVPGIIEGQIRSRAKTDLHREASVAAVRFNPFTLAATIERLRLSDRDGVDLLTFDLLHIDLQVSGLFRRALRFREIRIDRPVATARILADGTPSIADLMQSEPAAAREPFQLPRLIVDRFTVNRGIVRFEDAARRPVYETRFEPLSLDVTDLITIPKEGGAHHITVGVGDGAELRWSGQQTVEPLSFTGRLEVVGLDLHRVWDYAGQDQQVDVAAGKADFSLPYAISRGGDRQMTATLDGATARVRGVTVRPRDGNEDWLTVPELSVEGVKAVWPASRLDVERVRIVRPHALTRVEKEGTLNWARAFPASDRPPTSSDASPWTFRLASIEIDEGGVAFEDESTDPMVRLELAGIAARATGVSSDVASPVPVALQSRIGERGTIEIGGTIAPSPLAANVTLTASGLDLAPLRPYIRTAPGARINAGTAALQAEVMATGDTPTVRVSARGTVDGAELRDLQGERVMAWRRMGVDGLTLEHPEDRLRVRKVTLEQPFAKILIDRDGNLNLTSLVQAPSTPAKAAAPATDAGQGRTFEVNVVEIKDASAEFSDESLPLPFKTQIHSARGTIKDISSFAAAPATLAIEGRVDQTGYVKSDGTLRTSDPMASSEVTVEFRSIDMPGLTPYFADFAGYAVRSGVLDLDVRYLVKERRLVGSHKVIARDLVLGNRVDGTKDAPFPVRLAIALLKDKEGRINLEVPVEGTVDSPEFAYRKVFWSAVRTILANAATAPFRALGRMFGRDEDDLELVEFDPGRSDLLPADRALLARLAEQIGPRADLTLTVEGRFDPAVDTPALKRAKLEQLIEARRQSAAQAAAAAGGSTLETILESLYVEQFSADALQAERQKFTTAPSLPAVPPAPATAPGGASPATPPAQAAAAFDAAAFYESLRAKLLDAQPVGPADLASLATARATSITASLTGSTSAVDASRVTVLQPTQAKRQKRGSQRVASEMNLSADPSEGNDR
jgi:uncharacterized protein involved in outer membrane biogenesis